MNCHRIIKKGRVSFILILLIWFAVAAVIFGLTLTQRVNASLKKLPVYCVDTGTVKKASLTFDVAWGDETTDGILEILNKYSVKASFFFVGEFAEKYPESVRKICNAGHDVGNHSMRHNDPVKQTYAEICSDMDACGELLYSLTGVQPKLYRAPSGSYDAKTVEAAEALGMTVVQWDNDSIDWKQITPEEITKRVMRKLSPGSIMLFHLGKENTLRALDGIIGEILSQGYELVPVSELLIKGESYVDANGRQVKK